MCKTMNQLEKVVDEYRSLKVLKDELLKLPTPIGVMNLEKSIF